MTSAGWIALAIAVGGAFAYAIGSILQAVGARRSRGTVSTLGHPLYLIGLVFDLVAWAGSMVALQELAVYVVESILASSLAVTVVLARIFLKSRLRRRDVAAVVVSVGALTVLMASAGEQETVVATTELRVGFCVAAAAMMVLGWGAAKAAPPGVVSAIGGVSLGMALVVARALSFPSGSTGTVALAVVTEPLVWALLVFAVGGMLMYTHALQHGQVGPVTAVLWIGEVIAPSVVALAVLGDTVRPGWQVQAALAGLVVVGAAAVLASAPGTAETTAESQAPEDRPAQPQPALAGARPQAALAAAGSPDGDVQLVTAPRRASPPVPADGAYAAYATADAAVHAAGYATADAAAHATADAAHAAAAAHAAHAEKIIWWGPSPIWIPPARANGARAALTTPEIASAPSTPALPPPPAVTTARAQVEAPPAVPELTWNPPHRARWMWALPAAPDPDTVEIPVPEAPMPAVEAVPARPWQDMFRDEAGPAESPVFRS